MEKLHRVKTDSLRSQIYIQLKNQLLEGTWKVGEKIPSEHRLCETFGVSRVTVRAAIQQLEILGLVETKHGGGSRVKSLATADAMDSLHPLMAVSRNQDIITVLEYRKIVEKGTIGLAAEKATSKDIAFLESTYRTMIECTGDNECTGNTARFAEADVLFHLRIAQIAGNPIINKVYEIINQIVTASMSDIVNLLGCEIGLHFHRKLIDALASGDKGECEKIMEEHIDATIRAVLAKGS